MRDVRIMTWPSLAQLARHSQSRSYTHVGRVVPGATRSSNGPSVARPLAHGPFGLENHAMPA